MQFRDMRVGHQRSLGAGREPRDQGRRLAKLVAADMDVVGAAFERDRDDDPCPDFVELE
jgi:hypothetical protein